MERLDRIVSRLDRADKHLSELKKLVSEFRDSDPYGRRIKVYRSKPGYSFLSPEEAAPFLAGKLRMEGGPLELQPDGSVISRAEMVEEFGIMLVVNGAPKLKKMGAIAGDVIHNLRAALDNMVWELSEAYSGPGPRGKIPYGDPWRDIYFPVKARNTSGEWKQTIQRELVKVNPALHARFKTLQPFTTHRKRPERHWAAVLNELSNGDKHHSIAVLTALTSLDHIDPTDWEWKVPTIGRRSEEEIPDKIVAAVLKRRKLGPVKDGAELARIRMVRNLATKGGLEDAVNMNLVYASDIAFEQGPPAYGGRVIETLERLQNRVTAVVAEFTPELS
ncbi:MAG TPA: hypothetical protein VFA97_08890 [Gaiellaceae bacterium]|nr:hypothetical protein [Gaiellaceae bacterium]